MGPGGWIRGFAMAARGFRGVSLEVPSGRQIWVQSVSWADGILSHRFTVPAGTRVPSFPVVLGDEKRRLWGGSVQQESSDGRDVAPTPGDDELVSFLGWAGRGGAEPLTRSRQPVRHVGC